MKCVRWWWHWNNVNIEQIRGKKLQRWATIGFDQYQISSLLSKLEGDRDIFWMTTPFKLSRNSKQSHKSQKNTERTGKRERDWKWRGVKREENRKLKDNSVNYNRKIIKAMDLSTAKYIMDYIYFNRANDTAFQYHKKVSFVNSLWIDEIRKKEENTFSRLLWIPAKKLNRIDHRLPIFNFLYMHLCRIANIFLFFHFQMNESILISWVKIRRKGFNK